MAVNVVYVINYFWENNYERALEWLPKRNQEVA